MHSPTTEHQGETNSKAAHASILSSTDLDSRNLPSRSLESESVSDNGLGGTRESECDIFERKLPSHKLEQLAAL